MHDSSPEDVKRANKGSPGSGNVASLENEQQRCDGSVKRTREETDRGSPNVHSQPQGVRLAHKSRRLDGKMASATHGGVSSVHFTSALRSCPKRHPHFDKTANFAV